MGSQFKCASQSVTNQLSGLVCRKVNLDSNVYQLVLSLFLSLSICVAPRFVDKIFLDSSKACGPICGLFQPCIHDFVAGCNPENCLIQ
jgi:hypothetical protein